MGILAQFLLVLAILSLIIYLMRLLNKIICLVGPTTAKREP